MKALILNFAAFNGKKDPDKSYYRFLMYDLDGKAVYEIFQEQQYMSIPDGVIPSVDDQKNTFPRVADLDFSVDQYRNREGKQAWSPRVRAIRAWEPCDLNNLDAWKKLKK